MGEPELPRTSDRLVRGTRATVAVAGGCLVLLGASSLPRSAPAVHAPTPPPLQALAAGLPARLARGGADSRIASPLLDTLARLEERLANAAPERSVGIALQPLRGSLVGRFGPTGLLVADVHPGGPAAQAGLRHGDLLLEIGGLPVTSPQGALELLAAAAEGETTLALRRGRRRVHVDVRAEWLLEPPPARTLPASALPIGRLVRADRLAEQGLPQRAFVLEIEGVAPAADGTWPAAVRRASPPWLARLQPDTRRYFALVTP
jgi:membrane-associated protease RseP (regulator of RpoE activity)